MEKFSKELINAYINGDDVEYDIDELENNSEFMLLVLKETNDKNFYSLCSDSVKCNYEFVSYLIENYESDKGFVKKVGDYFLSKSEDQYKKISIALKLKKIFKNKRDISDEYDFFASVLVTCENFVVDAVAMDLEKKGDTDVKDDFGLGFIVQKNLCSGEKEVIDYIASWYLSKIFCDVNLEEVVHQKFKSVDELEKFGLNSFIINYISLLDDGLANYVSLNLNLIRYKLTEFENIKNNWNVYIENKKKEKYDYIIDKVLDYFLDDNAYSIIFPYSLEDTLFHFGKKYNVLDKLEENEPSFFEEKSKTKKIDISSLDINQMKIYKKIKNVFERALEGNYIDDYEEAQLELKELEDIRKSGTKILNLVDNGN